MNNFEHIPWRLITHYAKVYNVCPYLLAAIGQHETGWGKLVDHEFYMGYGAFCDRPWAYEFAGEERQIKEVADMMREWEMKPGKVTLDRLKAGNLGAFGRIYATDQDWVYGVWRWYNRIRDAVDLENIHFEEKEIERDEIDFEKAGWTFHIVRIVAIILLIVLIFWGIMNIFK